MNALPYDVVDLEQGSRAWHAWRHAGIGASDAPAILAENPWRSAGEVLEEKRGPLTVSKPNAAMARGTALEPEARVAYIAQTGIHVRPQCVQSVRHPWMRASLDGLSVDGKTVVEIKCGNSVYNSTARTGDVPDYYYGQLQHILAVTGLPSIDFWCYLPDREPLLLDVARDTAYIADLIAAEESFWQSV